MNLKDDFIIFVMAVIATILTVTGVWTGINMLLAAPPTQPTTNARAEYERGFNAALDAIMLLELEQNITHTRRTWGEMADIARERFNVTQEKP